MKIPNNFFFYLVITTSIKPGKVESSRNSGRSSSTLGITGMFPLSARKIQGDKDRSRSDIFEQIHGPEM